MSDLAIVWFRRDFRLADNPALDYARSHHERILPVYIHDPHAMGHWSPGAASRWWLHHALTDVSGRLKDRGVKLIIRSGSAGNQLDELIEASGAGAVYWNRLYEPVLVQRDTKIKQALREQAIEARSFRAAVLFEPWELMTQDDQPYRVFTPYWNRMQRDWRSLQTASEPGELTGPSKWPKSESIDSLNLLPGIDWDDGLAKRWQPDELAARRAVRDFTDDAIQRYSDARNRPDKRGTSSMSPYLHFGQISPRQIVQILNESGDLPTGKGALSYVRELAWREFSIALLHHFPQTSDQALQSRFRNFPWREAREYADDLRAWQRGQTGIPLVDAGMRELWHTGWMHNRVRMVVASFLTKNLLIPWQEGARWFWDTLVDADLANNTQGWQWTAGCGADAAPYFRIFNADLQAEKFDPKAEYIHTWCPELNDLDHKALGKMTDYERKRRGYPMRLVDLKATRVRALKAFDQIKQAN
ncbi:MAG: deoxyribodipyrimidine photo-lyase [Pseudomonadota bacterium]